MRKHRETCNSIDAMPLNTHASQCELSRMNAKAHSSIAESARGLVALGVVQAGLLAVLVWRVW